MVKRLLYLQAVVLLQKLIATPSLSREEGKTAAILADFLREHGVEVHQQQHNVWAFNKHYNPELPTLLLNSHHDTVKPNAGYTRNPFEAEIEDGKLYGLGSNDAGGCLVSLIATFLYFYERQDLAYNLVLAATAEEEISGRNGIELILPELGELEAAIVGEPTEMHLAIAEKGLLVLDCMVQGKAGHAAREEGINAIYEALPVIQWFQSYTFPKLSEHLGPLKMSVTMIQAGSQHNVVPDSCQFTVDVRLTDAYTMDEVLDIIRANVQAEVKPRSQRLKPSSISMEHLLVKAGVELGRNTYGSPTTSDQALLPIPSLKLGPGFSGRSHMADEFIFLHEIEEGIRLYIALLEKVVSMNNK
ncbi:M20 family metallo-hydrolase [Pontibacter akesuensis]|uniref:Acetylornithine deacetylase n=1 Tax=Pontibacter akesuensis TaxID=388950 RepID=A0A1I7FZ29_9BACT|nr:M20 family metallo-hydrolase [Pontibacter akesuensis]GHA59835.1 acetylornithine deacetylase [Pontibacter akesuensis]SFU41351.1 acetylornithine deacetylase [Pontibacter akesuensis]